MSLAERLAEIRASEPFGRLRALDRGARSPAELFRHLAAAALPVKLAVDAVRASPWAGRLLGPRHRHGDFHVPLLFLAQNPGVPPAARFHATVYLVVELLCYQSLAAAFPPATQPVASRRSRDERGNPLDLTAIARAIEVLLRKTALGACLAKLDPVLGELGGDYAELLLLGVKHPFDHCGPGGGADASILIPELAQFALAFGPLFRVVHFDPLCTDPHYRDALAFLDDTRARAARAPLHSGSPGGLRDAVEHLADLASRATLFLDDWGLGLSREADAAARVDRNPRSPLSAGALSLPAVAGAASLDQLAASYRTPRSIAGHPVVVEYQPALSRNADYERHRRRVAPHVGRLSAELSRLYGEREVLVRDECETSGEVSPTEYYRAEADLRIFADLRPRHEPEVRFYVMVLVDNSCSIHDAKRARMAEILTLLAETLLAHPDKFVHLAAYAQHSTGGRVVTLRRLVDGPTDRLRDPSPLLHLTSSGLNYDAFAAHEVVTSHARGFGAARPLLLVCGDVWPVSQTGQGVAAETRQVFGELRRRCPRLLTFCLGVDGRLPPQDLYDYFVNVVTQDPFEGFLREFGRLIERVLRDGEGTRGA